MILGREEVHIEYQMQADYCPEEQEVSIVFKGKNACCGTLSSEHNDHSIVIRVAVVTHKKHSGSDGWLSLYEVMGRAIRTSPEMPTTPFWASLPTVCSSQKLLEYVKDEMVLRRALHLCSYGEVDNHTGKDNVGDATVLKSLVLQ